MCILTLLLTFFGSAFLVKFKLFKDHYKGPQKIHNKLVSRGGGAVIVVSLSLLSILYYENFLIIKIIFSALPLFISGLLEDATRKISPLFRLIGGFISGGFAFFFIPAQITYIDVPYFDLLLDSVLFSLIFTAFAITGIAHAFNIIDGLNGLTAGISIISLASYSYIASLNNNELLFFSNLIILCAVLGFLIWNWPFGLIFLGDSGAYFLGFIVAILGILLVNEISNVSPWYPFVLLIYPIWETLFSIYRRLLTKNSPFSPDSFHLHHKIYRLLYYKLSTSPELKNSLASLIIVLLNIINAFIASLFYNNSFLLFFFTVLISSMYTLLYNKIKV